MTIMRLWWLIPLLISQGCYSNVISLPPTNRTSLKTDFDRDTTTATVLNEDVPAIVGVAFSGSGSRAALFSAAVLEGLARIPVSNDRSLLDNVSAISGVSDGSIAAAYYVANKPAGPGFRNGKVEENYERFFDEFRSAMAQDFEWRIKKQHLLKLRRPTTPLIAKSLAEALDSSFLRRKTFGELYKREMEGEIPHLIVNSTILNDGRRLVMTNLKKEEFNWQLLKENFEMYRDDPGLRNVSSYYTHYGYQREIPVTLEDLNVDKRELSLSTAVAASASLPFKIGPVTIQSTGSDKYWHLVDGGVFDNGGTESLFEFLIKRQYARHIKSKTPLRVVMIVVDTSYPFESGTRKADTDPDGSNIMADDPARVFDIMVERMALYQRSLLDGAC